MSAVCPKCGVAVVQGYVKCPKCQSVLPAVRRGQTHAGAGGTTAVGGQGMPVLPLVVGGAVALGIVLFFALRKDSAAEPPPAVPTDPTEQPDRATEPVVVAPEPTTPDPTPGSAAPAPTAAIKALDRALKKERLWSKVEVKGQRVEIRSAVCSDPGMATVLEAAAASLKSGGLTRLRCMEQSGAVVFERDL